MSMLGGIELRAQAGPEEPKKPAGPKVKVGLIGLGLWGREMLGTLGRLPQAEVAAICDTYPAMVRRSEKNAPGAATTEDYRSILDNKETVFFCNIHDFVHIAGMAIKRHRHNRLRF